MKTVNTSNAVFAFGGSDEKGLFVCWGPMLRTVYAVMIFYDSEWHPYKIYKNNKSKTLKRAKQHLKYYRKAYNESFKLEEIWEAVPVSEMEKTYYEETNQIVQEIQDRIGIGRRRVLLGLGNRDHEERVIDPEKADDKEIFGKILKGVGPEGTEIRVDPATDERIERQGTEK